MKQIDAIIDAGYHHALEEEKRKMGLSHYILDNVDELPQELLLQMAKKSLQEDLKRMTIEEIEKEFHGMMAIMQQNKASQGEKNVSDEKSDT